ILAETGLGATRPLPLALLAWVLAQLGEPDEALNRMREAEQLLQSDQARGVVFYHYALYHALGRDCLQLGQIDEALRHGRRALEASRNQLGLLADAQLLLGDIATHPEQLEATNGECHYHQALALAEPRGIRPITAHCHLGLGKLHLRRANRE